jgi:putative hydrolase of the HAD superfamily
MIETIIFDYGNVIFDIDHQLTINAFTQLGVQKEDGFFSHLKQNPLFDNFETGEISAAEFREGIRKIANIQLTDQQIDEAWNTLLLGIRDGYLEYLLEVKSKVNTYLLSNNNEIHYEWIINYLKSKHQVPDMSSFFIKDYYSHLMGMRKPNANIFEFVINTHQLNPSTTLFIDDSPQHLETAKKLGLKTHLMLRSETLQEVVSKYLY